MNLRAQQARRAIDGAITVYRPDEREHGVALGKIAPDASRALSARAGACAGDDCHPDNGNCT
jgi:hypothetical protein